MVTNMGSCTYRIPRMIEGNTINTSLYRRNKAALKLYRVENKWSSIEDTNLHSEQSRYWKSVSAIWKNAHALLKSSFHNSLISVSCPKTIDVYVPMLLCVEIKYVLITVDAV